MAKCFCDTWKNLHTVDISQSRDATIPIHTVKWLHGHRRMNSVHKCRPELDVSVLWRIRFKSAQLLLQSLWHRNPPISWMTLWNVPRILFGRTNEQAVNTTDVNQMSVGEMSETLHFGCSKVAALMCFTNCNLVVIFPPIRLTPMHKIRQR